MEAVGRSISTLKVISLINDCRQNLIIREKELVSLCF